MEAPGIEEQRRGERRHRTPVRGQPQRSGRERGGRRPNGFGQDPEQLGRAEPHGALDDGYPSGGVDPRLGPDGRTDGGRPVGRVQGQEIGGDGAHVRLVDGGPHQLDTEQRVGAGARPALAARWAERETGRLSHLGVDVVDDECRLRIGEGRVGAVEGEEVTGELGVEDEAGDLGRAVVRAGGRSHAVQPSERPLVADELAALRPRVPERQRGDVVAPGGGPCGEGGTQSRADQVQLGRAGFAQVVQSPVDAGDPGGEATGIGRRAGRVSGAVVVQAEDDTSGVGEGHGQAAVRHLGGLALDADGRAEHHTPAVRRVGHVDPSEQRAVGGPEPRRDRRRTRGGLPDRQRRAIRCVDVVHVAVSPPVGGLGIPTPGDGSCRVPAALPSEPAGHGGPDVGLDTQGDGPHRRPRTQHHDRRARRRHAARPSPRARRGVPGTARGWRAPGRRPRPPRGAPGRVRPSRTCGTGRRGSGTR